VQLKLYSIELKNKKEQLIEWQSPARTMPTYATHSQALPHIHTYVYTYIYKNSVYCGIESHTGITGPASAIEGKHSATA